MAIGTGSRLGSSWGRKGFGSHLPRKALGYADNDSAEKSVWEHWFFGTADAPAVPAYFAALFPDILRPLRGLGSSGAVMPAFQAPEQTSFFAAHYPDRLQPSPRPAGGAASPPIFEQLPAPDFGQRAIFPERLHRALALTEYPQPKMNLDPIPPKLSWKGISPDRLFRLYPEHTFAFAPPPTVETSAPTFFARYAPDRLYRFYPEHPAFHEPPHFETLPAPEDSWRAYFQDRLARIQALSEYPQPVMNLEPIPGEVVPDFFKANFQDRMLRHPPPLQPPFHYTPTPTNFLTLDDSSRGLYQGVRGLYENLESAHCEPWAGIRFDAQSVSNAAYTTLASNGVTVRQGFGAETDLDPWDFVVVLESKIQFKHPGYYIVGAEGQWANNSTGERRVRIRYFTPNGVAQRVVCEKVVTAAFTSSLVFQSDIQPFGAGGWLTLEVYQSSGGPLSTGTIHMTVLRMARPRTVLPI